MRVPIITPPAELIPDACGLIIADGFGAEIVRPSATTKLAGARRKMLTGTFGRLAALRLHRLEDPWLGRQRFLAYDETIGGQPFHLARQQG